MEGDGPRKSERGTSNFSVTCRKLSHYIKQKRRLGDLRLPISSAEAAEDSSLADGGTEESPAAGKKAMDRVSSPVDQMTIFYGGKVVVFNNFPAEKVNDLLALAARRLPAVPSWTSGPRRSAVDCPPPSSDLPIARKVSLHRFLEKRKDRVVSCGPPSSTSSPALPAEDDGEKWLVLGDLQR